MLDYFCVWSIIKFKQLANLFGVKHTKYVTFIILCEGRTGSTLLHTYLNSNRNIFSIGDVDKEIHYQTNGLSAIMKPFSKMIKAVGFKLFYDYESSKLFKDVREDASIKIIHLYREDRLRLFTSLKMAENSGNWSYNKQDDISNKRIRIDQNEAKNFVENYTKKKALLTEQFSNHDLIKISYEQLIESPESVLQQIQRFLKIKPKKLKSVLKKQNPEPLSELIINYDEICNLF